jgi:hypothetical protein
LLILPSATVSIVTCDAVSAKVGVPVSVSMMDAKWLLAFSPAMLARTFVVVSETVIL